MLERWLRKGVQGAGAVSVADQAGRGLEAVRRRLLRGSSRRLFVGMKSPGGLVPLMAVGRSGALAVQVVPWDGALEWSRAATWVQVDPQGERHEHPDPLVPLWTAARSLFDAHVRVDMRLPTASLRVALVFTAEGLSLGPRAERRSDVVRPSGLGSMLRSLNHLRPEFDAAEVGRAFEGVGLADRVWVRGGGLQLGAVRLGADVAELAGPGRQLEIRRSLGPSSRALLKDAQGGRRELLLPRVAAFHLQSSRGETRELFFHRVARIEWAGSPASAAARKARRGKLPAVGHLLSGIVLGADERGLLIGLPGNREGRLHLSRLRAHGSRLDDYTIGQSLRVRVRPLDWEDGRLDLELSPRDL